MNTFIKIRHRFLTYLLPLILIAGPAVFYGCSNEQQSQSEISQQALVEHPEWTRSANIYEVNIRQYTPEGTLNAFRKDLPRLEQMGVDILWLMPIHPIGEKNRKGELGSYYSIKDYRAVNPNFGTLEDFKALVKESHERGMKLIMDWVPNHTAWDHAWVTEHPEYYAKDSTGAITYEADWTDIALLNYENKELWTKMIDAMKYWITEADVDGFRVDHASHEIPMTFWEQAVIR
jgi:glycosidase